MQIVACAKTTQLLSFPDFSEISVHNHQDQLSSDFSFFKPNALIKCNKNWGCELLGIKSVDGHDKIVPLRKLKIENIQCATSPKIGKGTDFAIGLATGHIKLLDLKMLEQTVRFNPDVVGNGVSFLDFSSCNEYIAGVHENGAINIYGLKSRTKMQTIKLDGQSTLARYHPTKRFHLAVASFAGALTVYDTHVKKPYFQKIDCHDAPLKDLCMSAARPDLVVTAGYDNIINIYDTRTRSTQYSIESNHPFSTVAMSGCGDYLAVGNLKGEIIAYDFRKLEKVMNVKNLGQSTINRMAFVPTNGELSEKPIKIEDTRVSLLMNESPAAVDVEPTTTTQSKRDSFVDFLGFMEKKTDNNEYMSRISIGSNTSLAGGVRMSCGTRLSQDWRPNNHNEIFEEMFDDQPSNVNIQRLKKRQKDLNATVVDSIVEPKPNAKRYSLQHQSRVPELSQIVESDDKENSGNSDDFKTPDTTQRQPLKNDVHVTRRSSESTAPIPLANISNATNVPDLGKGMHDEIQAAKSEILTEIRQDLASTVQKELKKFEMSNAFDAERNKYHTFSVIFNTSRQLEKQYGRMQADVDTLKAGMSLLLQEDPFVQAYVRMKNENDELRRRLVEYENE